MGIVEATAVRRHTASKVECIAYLRPLLTTENSSSGWKVLKQTDIKKKFPSRGIITWFHAPMEARQGTIWFFDVEKQKSTFVIESYFDHIEVINVKDINVREPRFFLNLTRKFETTIEPAKITYLCVEQDIWIGPVLFKQQKEMSNIWKIDVQHLMTTCAFYEPLENEVACVNGRSFYVPPLKVLRSFKPLLSFDYETQASYIELKELYLMKKGKTLKPPVQQAHATGLLAPPSVKPVPKTNADANLPPERERQNLELKVHKVTSSASARSQIELLGLQNLGFGTEAINYKIEIIQAEAIRAALWMYSCEGTTQVHFNRFLRAAHRLMKPIWLYRRVSALDIADDGSDSETVPLDTHIFALYRPILSNLAQSGDVIKKLENYWLPAPLSIKAFSDKRWRFNGGVPLYRLSEQVRREMIFVGTERWLKCEPGTLGLER